MSLKNALWILPFMGFLGGYIILDMLFAPEFIDTPSVVGTNINQAVSILCQYNLNLRLLTSQENSLLEQGTILSQTPIAGQKIKENQAVYVVVSCKPPKIKTPDFTDKTVQEIQNELGQKKMNAKIYYLQSTYPQDKCFAQFPQPNTDLNETQKIIIYIAQESKKPHIMPNFKGKRVNEITDLLATYTAHITVLHYPPVAQDHVCACTITEQRPIAGSLIHKDSQKKLHIQLQAQES
jgi:beta-lactam-binding protein with PASTA domain